MEHKSFSLGEFKALDEPGTFDAIVAVFDNVDHGGDRIRQGAFKRTLSEWKAKGRGVPILWSHDSESVPIGIAEDVSEVKEGLQTRGARLFIDDNPVARSVWAAMKGGALQEFSFGYGVPDGGARKVLERGKQIRDLLDLDLGEISPVFLGMNPQTRLTAVKSVDFDLDRLPIDELKTLGDRVTDLIEDRQTKALDEAARPAENPPPEPTPVAETDPPPPTPTPVPHQEPDDKPEPKPDEGEEAKARIRALQAEKPLHLE